jgi:mercuric ion binding protein
MKVRTRVSARRGHYARPLSIAAVLIAMSSAHAALSFVASGDTAREAAPMAANVETVFEVRGMTCPMCAVTVRTAAKGVRGVVDVRVSREDQRAWVTYDPSQATPDAIAAAITKAGYPAKPLP